jgi:hypothetical protein
MRIDEVMRYCVQLILRRFRRANGKLPEDLPGIGGHNVGGKMLRKGNRYRGLSYGRWSRNNDQLFPKFHRRPKFSSPFPTSAVFAIFRTGKTTMVND